MGHMPCIQGWERVQRQSVYACILFGREDEVEVAVLASAEVELDRRHIRRQEFMCLLHGVVVSLAGKLLDRGGRDLSTVAPTDAEIRIASTPTVQVIRTLPIARKREGIFRRQTSAL